MRRLLLLATVALAGCARAYYGGTVDLARAERGEIFVENIRLDGQRYMTRAVATVDVPTWRLLNLWMDVENYPMWHTQVTSSKVLKREGHVVEAELGIKGKLGLKLSNATFRIKADYERNELDWMAYENDWLKSMETTIKLEPLGDGNRT